MIDSIFSAIPIFKDVINHIKKIVEPKPILKADKIKLSHAEDGPNSIDTLWIKIKNEGKKSATDPKCTYAIIGKVDNNLVDSGSGPLFGPKIGLLPPTNSIVATFKIPRIDPTKEYYVELKITCKEGIENNLRKVVKVEENKIIKVSNAKLRSRRN